MARTHTMTPKRRAALKKAQMASARKRRGKGKGKLAAANRAADSQRRNYRRGKIARAVGAALGAGAMMYYQARQERKFQRSMVRYRMQQHLAAQKRHGLR